MKQYRIIALLLTLLLALAACGEKPAGETSSASSSQNTVQEEVPSPVQVPFTLAVYADYSLNPTLAANRANLTLAPLLYEPLFAVDGHFQAQPVLCQSWTASEDKLVWTFTLRDRITFSDGTPFTAREAAEALELARSSRGRYAQRLADVALISGEDQNLTITLRRPNGDLPALLDIPIALGDGDRPLGTGPYVLTETGDEFSLTARSGWWQTDKTLPVQTIPLHRVSKSDDLIYAFDAGEVSLVDVDLMATNAMGYGGNYQTWDYATTDFLYLGFNTQEGLCRSPQVRRALAQGVDRNTITSAIYANHATPALLPVHPDSPLYSQSAAEAAPGYTPEGLATQTEELKLVGKELVLIVNSENVSKVSSAQHIVYQLEAAGLKVELRQLSFEDYTTALARGEFDLYLGETVFTANFDLAPLLGSGGALNYGGWWAEGADGLLWTMHSASPETKPAAAEALFELLNEQAPIVPIAFKNGSVLTQWGRLSGLSPTRGNVFYQIENWIVK
ncbi:peptide ABC transporter substrate-binding protein [Pseudoflavonifractor sp. 60]|uniref:ABC transporter substrate-binding protein n=1 Tax=Pseudoflavonifractor sp. 60 TaxID=2304576 RepID=UPI00136E3756|nr:ABC transporter substrate-binding protein [Pseudoflavonifractor sp. 60]NBI68458.1 peptide ABC transporter substrate-binding protein [Pseudoflavonifractor sp. 60]